MSLNYDKMLSDAYSKLPQDSLRHDRFDVPKPHCSVFGAGTILNNFKEICDVINRDPLVVLRFLSKEMATAGTFDGTRAVFQGRFDCNALERLIRRFVEENVICPVCKRPDTKIIKEKRLHFLVCEACGARSSVRHV